MKWALAKPSHLRGYFSPMTQPALPRRPAPSPVRPSPRVDIAALKALLDGPEVGVRDFVRQRLTDPRFAYVYGLSHHEHREVDLGWQRGLAKDGLGGWAAGSVGDRGQEGVGRAGLADLVWAFETGFSPREVITRLRERTGRGVVVLAASDLVGSVDVHISRTVALALTRVVFDLGGVAGAALAGRDSNPFLSLIHISEPTRPY